MKRYAVIGLTIAILFCGYLLIPPGGKIRQWARALPFGQQEAGRDLSVATYGPEPLLAPVPAGGRTDSEHGQLCRNFYKTICKKLGETRDPTGVVRPDLQGEIEALRRYEEIIRAHPDWSSAQVDEDLVAQIYTPKNRDSVISAFKWVRGTIEKLVDSQSSRVFSKREKQQLRTRIRKVALELPPPASVYGDEPDLFTKNDVYYERTQDGRIRLRVGGAFLFSVKSWFNLIFTLAHEFGHSIDPCEIRAEGLSFPAYDHLKSCFIKNGWVRFRMDRQECQRFDQMSEAFADWLAVQVSAEALKVFATEFHGSQMTGAVINSVRDLCEQDDPNLEVDSTDYPEPMVRIDEIFGRHPTVREVLGCDPRGVPVYPKPYCHFGHQGR